MAETFVRKKGLLFSLDMQTVLGVDDSSCEFNGRIPYGPKFIDDDVFSECPYKSVFMPDSIVELGNRVLENSKTLEEVRLPSLIAKLPNYLFSGCSALRKVVMPNVLEDFPEGLFENCESLLEIPFRAGISVLRRNVFRGCTSIKSLVIPDSVRRIESYAVADCTSLESVIFPSSIEFIDKKAFEGCNSIRSVRIAGENKNYYVGEDGNLYEKTDSDSCKQNLLCKNSSSSTVSDFGVLNRNSQRESYAVVKICGNGDGRNGDVAVNVKFFNENLKDEEESGENDFELENQGVFFLSEDEFSDFEDDDTFYSSEIGANDEELAEFDDGANKIQKLKIDETKNKTNKINETMEETKMVDENNIDSMLADIMGEKKSSPVAENVSVGTKELEVLSETMSVMEDSAQKDNQVKVTNDELEKLFAKNEENVLASQMNSNAEGKSDGIDPKIQILVDSAEVGKVLTFDVKGELPDEPDLFVIAEKTVNDVQGNPCFTPKLISCCKTFARIHDFRHVILLKGLPLDNDEFVQFFHHYIVKKNVVLACEAASPSALSEYCKKICEEARISLNATDLNEQRKRISVKTNSLIKLVIKDKYDC